ncbi:hypothetical protein KI387_044139, partial [Taxus chinensis]
TAVFRAFANNSIAREPDGDGETHEIFHRGPQHGGLGSDETSLGATESEKSPVEYIA